MTTQNHAAPEKRARTEADKLKAAGLNASRANLTLLEPEALTLITDPAHPLYDERVNIPVDPTEPIYLDILARGVEKPIEVRKNGERNDGRPILQVVDGRQRVQILLHINAQLPEGASKRKIPVNFVMGDDRDMVLRGLSSNLLRREETVLTKAIKAQKAMALGCGIEEIATACNLRTTKPVEDWLLVLNFIPEVKAAFNGELPASAIKTFAKVPREEQLMALEKVRGVGAKNQKQVAAATEAARTGKAYVAPAGMMTQAQVAKLLDQSREALKQARAHAKRFAKDAALMDDVKMVQGSADILERTAHLEGAVHALEAVLRIDTATIETLLKPFGDGKEAA